MDSDCQSLVRDLSFTFTSFALLFRKKIHVQEKEQLVQDLIPPPIIHIHMFEFSVLLSHFYSFFNIHGIKRNVAPYHIVPHPSCEKGTRMMQEVLIKILPSCCFFDQRRVLIREKYLSRRTFLNNLRAGYGPTKVMTET